MATTRKAGFEDALCADGPAPDRAGKMELYGWLVGSWELDVTEIREDGSQLRRQGEWHFSWALGGRAIQDVWIVPGRGVPRPVDGPEYYGTTLRTYDPRIDAWHVQWTDPLAQNYVTQIGRREGDRIVQEGTGSGTTRHRWSFSEITSSSFRWQGERSLDGGATWRLYMDFRARRAPDR